MVMFSKRICRKGEGIPSKEGDSKENIQHNTLQRIKELHKAAITCPIRHGDSRQFRIRSFQSIPKLFCIDAGINICSFNQGMSEDITNIDHLHTSLAQMHSLRMAEHMRSDLFRNLGRVFARDIRIFVYHMIYRTPGKFFVFAVIKNWDSI